MVPVLNYAKKSKVRVEDLGQVKPEDDVKIQTILLDQQWIKYKSLEDKENSLYRAVRRAYSWEFTVAIFWNIIVATLQLSSPFLLRRLIVFI